MNIHKNGGLYSKVQVSITNMALLEAMSLNFLLQTMMGKFKNPFLNQIFDNCDIFTQQIPGSVF